MKKVLVILSMLVVFTAAMFAEKKATYKVDSVVGKVSYEVSNGEWVDLKAGMLINVDANISTGLNSTLTVSKDGAAVTIKPMKKGKLNELASLTSTKTGVKIGSRITESDITAASQRTTKAVSTASSRASEAKADIEWDE